MNKKWIKAAGVRAVKTMAQTAIATIGAAAVLSAVEWPVVVSATVLFHKDPGNDFEVYNDFNSLLVNLYRCVRDKPCLNNIRVGTDCMP